MTKTPITERNNLETTGIDLMDSYQIAQTINNEDQKVAIAIQKCLSEIGLAIETIAQALKAGGRMAYFGAGTSGRLGVLDASECYPTFGIENGIIKGYIAGGEKALTRSIENSEDSKELGIEDFNAFNPNKNDIIVGISAGGGPKYVLTVLELAQQRGCKTIGISSNPEAKLKEYSDIFINPIVGEEVITGSSRMKSGTAQKMILNMLSTGAMIRNGKTYKNYMIDVRMLNEKLKDRGARFVSEITNISKEEAQKLVSQTNSVKLACVMAAKNCSCDEAKLMLDNAEGILRKVI